MKSSLSISPGCVGRTVLFIVFGMLMSHRPSVVVDDLYVERISAHETEADAPLFVDGGASHDVRCPEANDATDQSRRDTAYARRRASLSYQTVTCHVTPTNLPRGLFGLNAHIRGRCANQTLSGACGTPRPDSPPAWRHGLSNQPQDLPNRRSDSLRHWSPRTFRIACVRNRDRCRVCAGRSRLYCPP